MEIGVSEHESRDIANERTRVAKENVFCCGTQTLAWLFWPLLCMRIAVAYRCRTLRLACERGIQMGEVSD